MQADLDGKQILTLEAFHQQIAEALDFGLHYGRNLNALWDMLSGDVERPAHLVWHEAAVSRAGLGPEAFDMVIEVLRSAQEEDASMGRQARFTFALA